MHAELQLLNIQSKQIQSFTSAQKLKYEPESNASGLGLSLICFLFCQLFYNSAILEKFPNYSPQLRQNLMTLYCITINSAYIYAWFCAFKCHIPI